MTNRNSDLPQEILIEIFSRLPTKSIGKFKCLSKTWLYRFSTSHFINLHLNRKTHQQNLILVTINQSLYVITSPTKNDQLIELPNNLLTAIHFILGSCNGLVLLSCRDKKLLVLNPITRQQVIIPDSAFSLIKDDKSFRSFGFGYDYLCDDYKIVVLSRDRNEPFADVIDLYCVRKGVSKRVGRSPFTRPFPRKYMMPFVNDSVHWLTRTDSDIRIASFDLVNETFQEVPLPKDFKPDFVYNGLLILGGFLCIVDYSQETFVDVWIMKEYGVVDSWVRFSINRNCVGIVFRPVCSVGDNKLLLFTKKDSWVVWDLTDGSVKEVVGGGISYANIFGLGSFVDTLVSPEQYPSF